MPLVIVAVVVAYVAAARIAPAEARGGSGSPDRRAGCGKPGDNRRPNRGGRSLCNSA